MQTRRRILDAAYDCLVELGYARTTVAAVQGRAGVSTGRLLHHFGSREALFAAVVADMGERRLGEIQARLVPATADQDQIDAGVQAIWDILGGSLFEAWVEVWIAARTNPDLWSVLEPVEENLIAQARALAPIAFGAHSAHPRFHELVDLLSSSVHGHCLWRQYEPRRLLHPAALESLKRIAHEILR